MSDTAAQIADHIPSCYENVPQGVGLKREWFQPGGRYWEESSAQTFLNQSQSIYDYLRDNCSTGTDGEPNYDEMAQGAVAMLVNARIECFAAGVAMQTKIKQLQQQPLNPGAPPTSGMNWLLYAGLGVGGAILGIGGYALMKKR